MAHKTIVNQTPNTFIDVTIIPRTGSDPGNAGKAINIGSIAPGESKLVEYGNDENPYLDGMTVSVDMDGSIETNTEVVSKRGSAFDNTLNMNSMVIITAFGSLSTSGMN